MAAFAGHCGVTLGDLVGVLVLGYHILLITLHHEIIMEFSLTCMVFFFGEKIIVSTAYFII